MKKKIALVFGITGQDGSYLAELLLNKNYIVYGVKRRTSLIHTTRIDHIYKDIHLKSNLILRYGDVTDFSNVFNLIYQIKPDEVYNLAAQSNVGVSFELAEYTAQTDSIGTLRILEAIRILDKKRKIKFYQASTSEIFGNSPEKPYNEKSKFEPVSPYGTAKLYSYWMTRNYRDAYSIFASNGILFNHESFLRGNNFFIKKVITSAIAIKNNKLSELKVGNLNVKRDFGFAPKYVEVMWKMLQVDKPQDFIICSGKSLYLSDIIYYVFNKLKLDKKLIVQDEKLIRPNEIKDIYGDNSLAKKELNWNYDLSFFNVLDILIEEQLKV